MHLNCLACNLSRSKKILLGIVFIHCFVFTAVYFANNSKTFENSSTPCGLGCQSSPPEHQSLHDRILTEAKYTPAMIPKPKDMAINFLNGKQKVGDLYESSFKIANEDLCHHNGTDLKVLILITSAPAHEKHRQGIRLTWGHFSAQKDVALAFVFGNTTLENQEILENESSIYGDIIQGTFNDSYTNVTLKTVSMLDWVLKYCSDVPFVLKTDDDMFINVPLLLSFIDRKYDDSNIIYGRLGHKWKPHHKKASKYFVDEKTFSAKYYPDFLTGPAYLFTRDIVELLFENILKSPFLLLEDVLINGIIGESLEIQRVGVSLFKNIKVKTTDTCELKKTISIHGVTYEEQFDIHKRTLDGKTDCKKKPVVLMVIIILLILIILLIIMITVVSFSIFKNN